MVILIFLNFSIFNEIKQQLQALGVQQLPSSFQLVQLLDLLGDKGAEHRAVAVAAAYAHTCLTPKTINRYLKSKQLTRKDLLQWGLLTKKGQGGKIVMADLI